MIRRHSTAVRLLLAGSLALLLTPAARSWQSVRVDGARRPRILVTNDDGIDAVGIRAIVSELSSMAEVVVAAPKAEQSGIGQAVQLRGSVIVEKRRGAQVEEWAIDATPATCVLIALEHLEGPREFDLVVSGINSAENIGTDTFASGTVGAARMAADLGYPSIALSVRRDASHLSEVASLARKLVAEAIERKLPGGHILNVNFPSGASKSWKTPLLTFAAARGFDIGFQEGSTADRAAKGSESAEPSETGDVRRDARRFRASIRLHRGELPVGSDAWALAGRHVSVSLLRSLAAVGASDRRFEGTGSLVRWGFFQ